MSESKDTVGRIVFAPSQRPDRCHFSWLPRSGGRVTRCLLTEGHGGFHSGLIVRHHGEPQAMEGRF